MYLIPGTRDTSQHDFGRLSIGTPRPSVIPEIFGSML